MKIKTANLIGAALDWAAAECEGFKTHAAASLVILGVYNPSINWSQGGLIIEREGICVDLMLDGEWLAVHRKTEGTPWMPGPTLLIAAMRCYVASKLGDEVDIPEELLK